jgi:hypothetical protein
VHSTALPRGESVAAWAPIYLRPRCILDVDLDGRPVCLSGASSGVHFVHAVCCPECNPTCSIAARLLLLSGVRWSKRPLVKEVEDRPPFSTRRESSRSGTGGCAEFAPAWASDPRVWNRVSTSRRIRVQRRFAPSATPSCPVAWQVSARRCSPKRSGPSSATAWSHAA